MKKSSITSFILLFIVFPSFVGCYSLFLDKIEANSKSGITGNGEEASEVKFSSNPLNDRSDIVYRPIESTLNLSRIGERTLEPSVNATNTVEYNLITGTERVLSKHSPFPSTFQSTVEPFEGILDTNYWIEDSSEEEGGGLKASYVFPPDDRQKITSVTDFPWRTICKLYIETQDSSYYIGSGAIIDDFHVLTAGHCVYIHEAGGWASEIIVIPGMDGNYEPYGRAYSTNLRSFTGWIDNELSEHDLGVITLDRSIGQLTGWMGRQTEAFSSSVYTGQLSLAGYPGDLDSGESMYFDSDTGDRADQYNHWYWMDMAAGQSGSPVWRYDGNHRYILSINAYEFAGGLDANMGTRLDSNKFNQINTWLAEDNSTVVGDKPDLLDRDFDSGVSVTEVIKGETNIEIYSDVKNEGTIAASSFEVSFYLSENTAISSFDYLIGNVTINSLDPYNYVASDWAGVIPINIPDGSYYVGWIIDSGNDINEFNEYNNNVFLNSPKIEVVSPIPDFVGFIIGLSVIIGIIALISIAFILKSKRTSDLRSFESNNTAQRELPRTTSYSDVMTQYEPEGFKFCPICGYKRRFKARFCVNCGYKLDTYWE